jgi:hypothetical protein
MSSRFVLSLIYSCLSLVTASASAQDAPVTGSPTDAAAPVTGSAEPTPPPNAPAASSSPQAAGEADDYGATVLSGLRKAVLRDFDGALATLRDAASREPARAEAFCALGDVELAKNDVNEARAAFQTCSRFALSAGDARMIALALIGEARVFEREGDKHEEREAWKRVSAAAAIEHAKTLADTRIAALDAVLALDAEYEAVRTRIAQRKERAEKKLP